MTEVFLVSLCVSIVTTILTAWQAKSLRVMIAVHLLPDDDAEQPQGSINLPEEMVQVRVGHALDVAVNLPAALLTLVAFFSLPQFESTSIARVFLATLAVCGTFVLLARPRAAGQYWAIRIGPVSIVSIVIMAANGIGLFLATQ